MSSADGRPTWGVVLLTMGRRPAEMTRALESMRAQTGVALDIVVVGNGWNPTGLPEGVRAQHLPENLGIPAGRNAGVGLVEGEFIAFIDDDAWLLDDDFLLTCTRLFREDPGLGMMQARVTDPDHPGQEPRRWIPRMRKGDPRTTSAVFSVIEMVVVLPRAVFDAAGGWAGEYFYAHEGIELAWRVWDQGKRVEYRGDLRIGHPVMEPTRHEEYYYTNARNRVWLARRCLHWPFSWAYVASWTAVQIIRGRRDRAAMRTWWRGWRDGWRLPAWAGKRPRKLAWRTIWAMSKAGRPPLV